MCIELTVCVSVCAPRTYNINLLPHLRFLAFKGHGRPGAVCVFLCVCFCVYDRLVKGCDSRATIRGHHPQDPRGWTIQSCATQTHTCYLQRGTEVPCRLSHVFVAIVAPPPPFLLGGRHLLPLFPQMPADFETSSAKKDTNEIHINVLRR